MKEREEKKEGRERGGEVRREREGGKRKRVREKVVEGGRGEKKKHTALVIEQRYVGIRAEKS